MIEQLFGSKTRVKLLHLFLSNPNRAFYVREITRKIDEQINSVRRELSNMLSIGIITSDSSNNRLYYEVNQKYEHYDALKAMFGDSKGKKSVTVEEVPDDDLTKKLKKLGSVDVALLSGSFTRDESAPVDLLIVGDINKTRLTNLISELEESEGREISYTTMSTDQFGYRKEVNDRFISDVLNSKKTVLVDKNSILKAKKK